MNRYRYTRAKKGGSRGSQARTLELLLDIEANIANGVPPREKPGVSEAEARVRRNNLAARLRANLRENPLITAARVIAAQEAP